MTKRFGRRERFVFLLMFFMIVFSGVSRGAAPRPRVRLIRAPLLTAPVFVSPGGVFAVTTRLHGGAPPVELRIILGGFEKAIPFAAASGTVLLSARIPAGTPPGLYDLEERFGDGERDDQPRAVRVAGNFPERFRFAVVSDIHYGDVRGVVTSRIDFSEVRSRVLDAAGRSDSDFVLFTGDITFAPFSFEKDYPKAWEEIFRRLTAPVFAAPGNHDMYRAGFGGREMGDGVQYWGDTFGPAWGSFDYGAWHFVALDTYDWPAKYRSAGDQKTMRAAGSLTEGVIGEEQWKWLRGDLDKARRAGRRVVVFGHHPPETFTTGPMAAEPGFHAARDLFALLRSARVRYYLCGHIHANREWDWGGVRIVSTGTAGSDTAEGFWGYREFEARPDGSLKSRAVAVVKKPEAKTSEGAGK